MARPFMGCGIGLEPKYAHLIFEVLSTMKWTRLAFDEANIIHVVSASPQQ